MNACDTCGQPVGNSGTVCDACITKAFTLGTSFATATKGANQAMSDTPVDDTIYVEYNVKILIGIDMGGSPVTLIDKGEVPTPTGAMFAWTGTGFVPAGVAEPPPKFSSIKEAEEWMEANVGKTSAAVEVRADHAERVRDAAIQAAPKWKDWI